MGNEAAVQIQKGGRLPAPDVHGGARSLEMRTHCVCACLTHSWVSLSLAQLRSSDILTSPKHRLATMACCTHLWHCLGKGSTFHASALCWSRTAGGQTPRMRDHSIHYEVAEICCHERSEEVALTFAAVGSVCCWLESVHNWGCMGGLVLGVAMQDREPRRALGQEHCACQAFRELWVRCSGQPCSVCCRSGRAAAVAAGAAVPEYSCAWAEIPVRLPVPQELSCWWRAAHTRTGLRDSK